MDKTIETYLTSQFIDYKGLVHHFVICAITEPAEDDDFETLVINLNKESHEILNQHRIYRVVKLGYAVCNPIDKFDEELGAKLAKERALTEPKMLFSSNPGIVNTTMIEGLLKQEANFIRSNPGTFIKGYSAAKKKYKQEQAHNKKRELKISEKQLTKLLTRLRPDLKPDYIDQITARYHE